MKNENVEVLFPPTLTQVARETAELVPEIRQDLEEIFNGSFFFKPTIILMNDPERFRRMTGSPLIVGFAIPKKNLVVIDYTKIDNHLKFKYILKHELCHLLLHEHLSQVPIPRWFDEGIAQWVSEGVMDILHDQKDALLPKAAFSDRMIPLGALNEGFPQNPNALRLAYEESKNFIDYLIKSRGRKKLFEILRLLKEGTPFRKAFFKALGTPLYEIEKEWLASLKQNINWFAHLSYYLYEIIFALGGLILCYGFIRLWRKKKAYMEEE
ncbi:MAG: hypothetical protein LJE96_15335 [Deltaproteobacteria bacterium]|nr:hypothetical protein [Deltaproteobacteria bacterium]